MLIFRGLPGTADPFVKINTYDYKTSRVLETVDEWSKTNTKSVTINAIDNGKHGLGGKFTFHGLSLAWDFGITNGIQGDFASLSNYLKIMLPPPFQVINEFNHVHVEWDTGQGR